MIIDPLDGSLNARRMLPSFSLSIAVASGPTMADVEVAYVYDFGSDEEYFARRGAGAPGRTRSFARRGPGFGLEVVGIEGAKPERLIPVLDALRGRAYRMRSVGSIAISLCYVAGGRFDAMMTGRASRSVDAAAGQLVAREAGAEVAFAGSGLDVSLDLEARYHVAAALDREMLDTVLESQRFAEPTGRRDVAVERFVDWRLAQRVAEGVAGGGHDPASFSQAGGRGRVRRMPVGTGVRLHAPHSGPSAAPRPRSWIAPNGCASAWERSASSRTPSSRASRAA